MFQVNNPCYILDRFTKLNERYNLFATDGNEKEKVNSEASENERKFRLKKNKKISKDSKKFSEKALIFSEDLARTINDKLEREKRVSKIKKLEAHKIICLSNLEKKTKEELESMGELLIELNKKIQ